MDEWNLLITPSDCDFIQCGETLTFEKQHAYVGKFAMNAGKENEVEFELTEDAIDNFVKESNRYIENGNKCNLPVEHTDDPEKNRGTNKYWYKKPDSKGRPGLFSLTEFRDAEAAKLALTAQTSIFAPAKYTDGAKNEYTRPIRHVALTDYPVIPGLDGFTPIAASLVSSTPKKEKTGMPILKDLAEGIGLQLSEDIFADEAKASKAIVEGVQSIKDASDLALSEYKKLHPPKADPVKVSKAHLAMLRENREMKLSELVKAGNITPAVSKGLQDLLCSEASLTLCLSEDYEDNFDKIVSLLKDNDPIKLSEVTGPQATSVATLMSTETNPMMKEAARRKAALTS